VFDCRVLQQPESDVFPKPEKSNIHPEKYFPKNVFIIILPSMPTNFPVVFSSGFVTK
jgi:hypothetical protein